MELSVNSNREIVSVEMHLAEAFGRLLVTRKKPEGFLLLRNITAGGVYSLVLEDVSNGILKCLAE